MIKKKKIVARLFLTAALLLAFPPRPLAAAPFCIESAGIPAACWYYDVKECKTAARKGGARCLINPKEIRASRAGAPYCIVDSTVKPSCTFQSWEGCEGEAARRNNAVCFRNSTKPNADPYRFDRMPSQPK